MPNIGPGELIVILLVALLVFGPRKLPELGKSLGAGLREFRRSTAGLKEELESGFKEAPAAPAPAPVRQVQPEAQTIHIAAAPAAPVSVQAVPPQAVTPAAVTPGAATPVPDDKPSA